MHWGWMLALWGGCFSNAPKFTEEAQQYKLYVDAVDLASQEKWEESSKKLQVLLEIDPNARAAWERLLVNYLEMGKLDEGNAILEEYLHIHPGDSIFRLLHSKYALARQETDIAIQDIQLLLHNKAFHTWRLGDDQFLRQYRDNKELGKYIHFGDLQLLHIQEIPSSIVGDTVMLDIEFLQRKSCEIRIDSQYPTDIVRLEKIQQQIFSIDDYVQKTTLSFIWKTIAVGILDIAELGISCVHRETNAKDMPRVSTEKFSVGRIEVQDLGLANTNNPSTEYAFYLPNTVEASQEQQDGVIISVFRNKVLSTTHTVPRERLQPK